MSTPRIFLLSLLILALPYMALATIHVDGHASSSSAWYDTVQIGKMDGSYVETGHIVTFKHTEKPHIRTDHYSKGAEIDPLALLSVGAGVLGIATGAAILLGFATILGFVSFFRIVKNREKRKGILWATLGILIGLCYFAFFIAEKIVESGFNIPMGRIRLIF